MGIKLNIGISKKIGLPDYGSAGGSCNLEIELDNAALDRPEEFHRRVREAYAACRSAVEDELRNHRDRATPKPDTRPRTQPKTEYRNSEPTTSPRNENIRHLASEKQMKFITQLCRGIKGLDNWRLDAYCTQEFGKTSKQLSAQDASKLIDMLKDAKANGGLAS